MRVISLLSMVCEASPQREQHRVDDGNGLALHLDEMRLLDVDGGQTTLDRDLGNALRHFVEKRADKNSAPRGGGQGVKTATQSDQQEIVAHHGAQRSLTELRVLLEVEKRTYEGGKKSRRLILVHACLFDTGSARPVAGTISQRRSDCLLTKLGKPSICC